MYQHLLHACFETRYDFEIENSLGVVRGSVQLVVEAEHVATQQETTTDTVTVENLESNPIAEEKFREYIAGLHLMNNKAFEIQYKVYYFSSPCKFPT